MMWWCDDVMVMMMMMLLMMMMMIMIMIMDHDDCKCGATSGLGRTICKSWNEANKSGKKHGSACFCCIVHLRCSKAIKQHRESIASFAECRPLGSSSSAEVSIACHEYSWVICVGQCFSILDRTNCVLSASSERTISKDFLTLCMGRNGKHLSHTDTCYRLRLSPRRL